MANNDDRIIYLTKRQREVLKLMIAGYSNPHIAETLSVSLSTAKAHVSAIIKKFDVKTRIDVTREAMKRGLLD